MLCKYDLDDRVKPIINQGYGTNEHSTIRLDLNMLQIAWKEFKRLQWKKTKNKKNSTINKKSTKL